MAIYLLGAFILSALCGALCIPAILDFCERKKLYDIPNERKVHKNATPRLGGICFMPGMMLAFFVVVLFLNPIFRRQPLTTISLWSAYFFISLTIIYVTGIIDDLIGLNAQIKFAAQIVAAMLMPLASLSINNLYGFCGIYHIPVFISAPLTIFVMVFIINAINLIDGIDGLAASLSFLALGGFLVSFMREHMLVYSILIAGLMGILIPFLYYNLLGDSRKNRKIFMGDSGSLTLGFILSFLFVKFASENPNVTPFHPDGLLIPYTLLIVPVFDVARVILVRMRHHKPLFSADKNHIHHKLMRAGLSQHQTLAAIVCLSLAFILLNIPLFQLIGITPIVILDIILYTLLHMVLNLIIKRRGKEVIAHE